MKTRFVLLFCAAIAAAMLFGTVIAFASNPNTAVFPGATVDDSVLLVASPQATTTLASSMDAVQTTVPLTSGSSFRFPTIVSIESERILCASKSTNTLTSCTRGYDGTAAATHASGKTVGAYVSSYQVNQIAAELKAVTAGDFGSRTVKGQSFTASGSSSGSIGLKGVTSGNTVTLTVADSTGSGTLTVPGGLTKTLGATIASGQTAMPTGALSANSCSGSATTAAATGSLTTDVITITYASDPTGVTGYGGGTSGGITVRAWPTADTVNFKLCNETGSSITPGALSTNWKVSR